MGVLDTSARVPEAPREIDDRKLVAVYRGFERENEALNDDIRALKRKAAGVADKLKEVNDYLEKILRERHPTEVLSAATRAADVNDRYERFLRSLT